MANPRSTMFITISGATEEQRELVARVLYGTLSKFSLQLDHVNVNEDTIEQYDLYPDRQMLQRMYNYPVKITTSPGPKPKRKGKGGRPTHSHNGARV